MRSLTAGLPLRLTFLAHACARPPTRTVVTPLGRVGSVRHSSSDDAHSVLHRQQRAGVKVRSSLTQRSPKPGAEQSPASEHRRDAAGQTGAQQHGPTTGRPVEEVSGWESLMNSSRSERTAGPGDSNRSSNSSIDLSALDVLSSAPAPASAIDGCTRTGFVLSGGVLVERSGVLIVGGEPFRWNPAGHAGLVEKDKEELRLERDDNGRWAIPDEAMGVLEVIWPKPDILIIGTGATYAALAPSTRTTLDRLGIRVDLLDTRNASAHYNLLATERGVDEIAAMMVPVGYE